MQRIESLENTAFPPTGRGSVLTVHEMARDEARHGKALKGLLERYFK